MIINVIGDTHIGHDKLHSEFKTRPEDFAEQILENTSKQSGDILIHLGDAVLGKEQTLMPMLMESLRGFRHKVLVRGNHDNKSDSWYYAQGWDFVCESFMAVYFGKLIVFSHAPLCSTKREEIDFNVHGHLHGTAEKSHRDVYGVYDEQYHIDVAPELRGYKAIDLEALIKFYEQKDN